MRHERDSRLGDRFDLRNMAGAAFELYCLRASGDKLFRCFHCLLGRVVAVDRHIGDKQGLFHATSDRARVMQHLIERH